MRKCFRKIGIERFQNRLQAKGGTSLQQRYETLKKKSLATAQEFLLLVKFIIMQNFGFIQCVQYIGGDVIKKLSVNNKEP